MEVCSFKNSVCQLIPLFVALLSLSVGKCSEITQNNVPQKLHNNSPSSVREGRAVHEIYLSDPLDCLSQLVCGLNTFPPQVPSARTTSANDYAFLLKNVMLRLKKHVPAKPPPNIIIKATTVKPEVQNDDDPDEDEEEEEEDESEIESVESKEEETPEEKKRKKLLKNSKDQNADVVEMKGLYPPFGLIDYRKGRASRAAKSERKTKTSKRRKNKKTAAQDDNQQKPPPPPQQPLHLTPLEQLKIEQDIRSKLRSNARCLYGILEHTCPFKYTELMILMSGILERQKVMSYSTNAILPMVGYLLKSRSLTQTLKATFHSLEMINNITITKHRQKEPFTFGHVYEEITHGDTGGNGLQIVETRNDASEHAAHSWEDDEFDAALKNPFLPKDKIPGFVIKDRSKNKKKKKQSKESEEEDDYDDYGVEENDTGKIPESESTFVISDLAGFLTSDKESSTESDEDDEKEEIIADVPLPAVYGVEELKKKQEIAGKNRKKIIRKKVIVRHRIELN